jgi:NaMN:DMB phosphoribosyltransferase
VPGNAHALKQQVVCAALSAAGLEPGSASCDPLGAVAAVGDPMQPVLGGMALAASSAGCDVLLAGGSQMLAVAAFVQAIGGSDALARVSIGTTRWVVADPAADVAGLAADIALTLPVLAVNLDFAQSRHAGLQAYEHWLVKEGVGAGGAAMAALLATAAPVSELEQAIDLVYDDLVGRLS